MAYNYPGMNISPHQRVINALLIETKGITLEDFIADRRDPGSFKSYDHIARDLREVTNGIADVSYRTIERWHENYTEAVA